MFLFLVKFSFPFYDHDWYCSNHFIFRNAYLVVYTTLQQYTAPGIITIFRAIMHHNDIWFIWPHSYLSTIKTGYFIHF